MWGEDRSGLQPSGVWWALNLGLRPRLVWGAPLALYEQQQKQIPPLRCGMTKIGAMTARNRQQQGLEFVGESDGPS
jgi:hypothetical protein